MRTETTTNQGDYLETIIEVDGIVVEKIWKPLPGDALESFLTSYGVTKEWWIKTKEEFGLPPRCNCDASHEWLNKVAEANPTIAHIGVKILHALTRKNPNGQS